MCDLFPRGLIFSLCWICGSCPTVLKDPPSPSNKLRLWSPSVINPGDWSSFAASRIDVLLGQIQKMQWDSFLKNSTAWFKIRRRMVCVGIYSQSIYGGLGCKMFQDSGVLLLWMWGRVWDSFSDASYVHNFTASPRSPVEGLISVFHLFIIHKASSVFMVRR